MGLDDGPRPGGARIIAVTSDRSWPKADLKKYSKSKWIQSLVSLVRLVLLSLERQRFDCKLTHPSSRVQFEGQELPPG